MNITQLEDSVIYWVSETTLGGAGVVESFAYNVADSPNKLFDNLESVITPSESELIDEALTQIVKFSQIDDDLKQIMYDLRNVTSLRSRQVHWSITEHFNKLSNRYIGKEQPQFQLIHDYCVQVPIRIWIYYTIGFWRFVQL